MICNCGYEFDESAAGIYGCPNCEGESMYTLVPDGATREIRFERIRFRGEAEIYFLKVDQVKRRLAAIREMLKK